MAVSAWIVGRSGSGKSTSYIPIEEKVKDKVIKIKGLDPKTTVVINTDDKALPANISNMYSEQVNYFENIDGMDPMLDLLKKLNKTPQVKSIVIDTWSRWASNIVDNPTFDQGDGRKAWKGFANNMIFLLNTINKIMRKDIVVYMLAHPEEYINEFGIMDLRIASQGQMLNARGGVESFSTIVLYTQKVRTPGKPDEYSFRTNNFATAKSPLGMFVEENIPNDLGIVDEQIRAKINI